MEFLKKKFDKYFEKILFIIFASIAGWYFFIYNSDENIEKRIIERAEKENIYMFGEENGKKLNKTIRETNKRLNTHL